MKKKLVFLEDFDYHDNINAKSYEKYFENVCKLLKATFHLTISMHG